MTSLATVRTLPVIETFGPTIQGEGPLAGVPTYFVRFGLCDFRCEWCDSMYAVEPELVKLHAEKLTPGQIGERLDELTTGPGWVTLSGGNPAVHDLAGLVLELHTRGLKVAVETQGSKWRPWLADVDMLVASPKPPSSGMVNEKHDREWDAFRAIAEANLPRTARALKIVVFDEDDYVWASARIEEARGRHWRSFLSVGTPVHVPPLSDKATIQIVLERYRWLAELVASDPALHDVAVYPQLHVLAWGQARGV